MYSTGHLFCIVQTPLTFNKQEIAHKQYNSSKNKILIQNPSDKFDSSVLVRNDYAPDTYNFRLSSQCSLLRTIVATGESSFKVIKTRVIPAITEFFNFIDPRYPYAEKEDINIQRNNIEEEIRPKIKINEQKWYEGAKVPYYTSLTCEWTKQC
jgi:hypothetical protein